MSAPPAKSSPRDAQVMGAILKDLGVADYEPRLINQMLEFVYRYVTDVLDDAKVYSNHASKKSIDTEDVKLAVQCRMDHSFTTPPPKDLLMEVSKHKNGQVLPLIKPYTGLRLPPDRYCLSSTNYKLAGQRTKKQSRIQIGLPMGQFPQRLSLNPLVHGKVSGSGSQTALTVVTKSMGMPTVTLVTKSSQQQHQQQMKPAIRISSGLNPLGGAKSFNLTSPSINIQGASQTLMGQPSLGQMSLKRKHEDDDYDNPT
ncbi:hypothetical protein FSP39_010616 [Pinctada imbricata]|uniref:Transcription initiation factor TFIID subunit 9 n=1 Tax=Pinctada imbricata TaxID=66713 RepID=A0AA88Y9Y2_PINIB|nr:hypothetical protein FSP39_010616 [Pinctada imbricata]